MAGIEYDPNRSAPTSPCFTTWTEKSANILAPQGSGRGTFVMSGSGVEIRPGNALP